MTFPQRAYDNIVALYNANLNLANGSEDDRRKLTKIMAEQNCFDLGKDWGTKSTSSSGPQSKDAIAFRTGPGSMDIWDWQNGTTKGIQVKANSAPDYPNITNQFFIQVVPVNHLAIPVPGDDPPEDNDDPPSDDETDETEKLLLMQIVSKLSELVEETKTQTVTFKTGLAELKAEISKGIKIRF